MCPICNTTDPADSVVTHMREHDATLTPARALGLFYGMTVGNPTECA